tara:strand:+ start:10424 stop:10768 length:345 start_codon:yes stop_codon:yes gene_type:complete
MLNFKEFMQGQAAFLPSAWTGSETGVDADKKSPVGSVDMPIKAVEKTGIINRLEKNSNPVLIGLTDGSDINISWDHLRAWLGNDPWSKLDLHKNITVKYDHPGQNARISGITIH